MRILSKFKEKEFMQKVVIELVGDVLMLIIGLVFAYYIKVLFFA